MKQKTGSLELYAFIAKQLAMKVSRLHLNTKILIDGDDAAEFLMAYSERFGVDLSEFPYNDYFGPEGCSPWGFLLALTGRLKYKSLTIQMLEDGVRTGRLQG